MDDRRNVHIKLTDEAAEGYRRICDEANVSLTALLEAAGLFYERGGQASPEFITEAQNIDKERRSRLRQ